MPRRKAGHFFYPAMFILRFCVNTFPVKIKLILGIILLTLSLALICTPTFFLPEADIAELYLCAGGEGEDMGAFCILQAGEAEIQHYVRDKNFLGMRWNLKGNTYTATELAQRLLATYIRRSDVDGRECVYAYSPLMGRAVEIDGQKVNVQIVQGENCLIAGTPLIMSSY